jgi:hypothetical protein
VRFKLPREHEARSSNLSTTKNKNTSSVSSRGEDVALYAKLPQEVTCENSLEGALGTQREVSVMARDPWPVLAIATQQS